ncbi:hypothetical protein [Halorubrum aethiopicum]|uniref:hypothetical protein n=1 Tax=Halorubrum aethiopicum TaxID=1758255 RepID=UPI000B336BD5|nr:hypothetical protein [Halorubrum aethiopicum]
MKKYPIKRHNISAESVPKTLREHNQWICWRHEEGKKPPFDPETNCKRNPINTETWSDLETALDSYRRGNYDGIGFVLTDEDPFAGVDFDDIREPSTGDVDEKIEGIIKRLNSYSEVSPSGTGIHTLIQGEKPSGYTNIENIEVYDSKQYFTFSGEHLESTPKTIKDRREELISICEQHLPKKSTRNERDRAELPADDGGEKIIEEARGYIRDFLYGQETGPRARKYYNDLLNGRYAKRGFKNDRSGAETTLCSFLYGIFLDGGADRQQARSLTYHYFTHAATENPYTKRSGERRKWVAGSADCQRNYRQNTLDYAIENFEFEIWNLWRQSGNRKTNDYSEHAYEIAMDALYELTVAYSLSSNPPTLSINMTPESQESGGGSSSENPYPTMGEIVERARKEYELSEGSYENILRNIRQKGGAKMARIGSSTYVYYPATYPDPADACYVKVEGKKRDPEPESQREEWNQEVMTDRGTISAKPESN